MLHLTSTTLAGIGIAAAIGIGAGAAGLADSHGTSQAASSTPSSTVIKTATATVSGKARTILTNGRGLPLYYYAPDKPKQSLVSGGLAGLWPAVTSTTPPAARGLAGSLTIVRDAHGNQVAYNGHLLYTFISDRRGVVTGQGVEKFFVATPNLSRKAGTTSPSTGSGSGMYGGAY